MPKRGSSDDWITHSCMSVLAKGVGLDPLVPILRFHGDGDVDLLVIKNLLQEQ